VEQLMKIGEKYGSRRKSHARGRKQNSFTQDATGFMSLHTICSLLGGGRTELTIQVPRTWINLLGWFVQNYKIYAILNHVIKLNNYVISFSYFIS
jgi:hypothetical protein